MLKRSRSLKSSYSESFVHSFLLVLMNGNYLRIIPAYRRYVQEFQQGQVASLINYLNVSNPSEIEEFNDNKAG